jgi:hypothetical protein
MVVPADPTWPAEFTMHHEIPQTTQDLHAARGDGIGGAVGLCLEINEFVQTCVGATRT